jgi:hypothetical protein
VTTVRRRMDWIQPLNMERRETWPVISHPCIKAWKIWRWALKRSFLSRGRRLKNPWGAGFQTS